MRRSRPFKIQIAGTDGLAPTILDGTMLQEARLPRWFFRAVAAVAAVALALVALWFAVLKPTIHDQARAASQQQSAQATKQSAAAQQAAQQAENTAAQALTIAKGGQGSSSTTTPTPATTVPGPLSTATGGRIALTAAPGQTSKQDLGGIPSTRAFALTDVVFEDPNGDTGTITIMRGNDIVLQESLEDFRSLDYHFVSPIIFPANVGVTASVACKNPTTQSCAVGVYVGGYLN